MEEVQSRFQHLLQPIRDLTQNWEVDVAAQLGEYLEELDQISISFDGGKTTMNFTEAALLIQGSACVYSRKVEHLYNLVYQALDHISKKKREKLPTSLRPNGRDADAIFPEEQDEFLSLDDIPEVSPASVTLRSDQQPAAVKLLPLIPMCLVPPDETERRENPLLSRRGEVLASRKDFRMNTCVPHASGAFLLEPSGLLPSLPGTAPGAPGSAEQPSSGAGVAQVRALSFSEEPGGDDDNDNDDDNDIPGAMEDDMEVAVTPKEHIEAQRSVPQSRGYILRERPASQDPKPHSKEVTDPWQCLDPFAETKEKPFKKGRPFTVPPGLADQVGGKRSRTDHRELQDFASWYSETYDNYIPESRRSRRRGPTFADLEDLYWQHFKERQEVLRKLQKRGESPRDLGWQEQQREDDCEEGADNDMEHEDVEPEALEELGEGGAPEPPEPDYEELVRRNVELFMASSEKYAQETELSQRIRLWEEKMESLLQEQESRVPFDVRAYGEALAGRCGSLGQWHSLASLVAGQPPFEVCRYVLAMLQLANDKVVELAQDAGLEVAVDTARLRLLSTRPAHERFQNYQLPSQKDSKNPK